MAWALRQRRPIVRRGVRPRRSYWDTARFGIRRAGVGREDDTAARQPQDSLDAPLADLQYAPSKLPRRIAIHGGTEPEGVLNQARPRDAGGPLIEGSRRLTEAGYPVAGGSSFVMALEYTNDGPRAMAILTYSQSDNPDSEHFADQTELFSKKQWRPILFTGKAIAADTKRDYEVSAPRR